MAIKQQLYRWCFTLFEPLYSVNGGPEIEGVGVEPIQLYRVLTSLDTKLFNFQKEKGVESGKIHYQGRFTLKKKVVKKTLLKAFLAAFKVEFPLMDSTYFQQLMKGLTLAGEMGTVAQSTAYCEKSATAIPGSQMYFPEKYMGQDLFLESDVLPKYYWTTILDGMIDFYQSESRQIWVISDPEGNSGKSTYIKKSYFMNPDKVGIITLLSNPSQINCALIDGGPKKVYFLDLPRSYKEPLGPLFSVLESLKNGLLTSGFYGKQTCLIMKPPIVIVFTNRRFTDDERHLLLTEDRWVEYKFAPMLECAIPGREPFITLKKVSNVSTFI